MFFHCNIFLIHAVNIITEIEHNGKKILVGIALNPVVQGKRLEVNDIRNVFPKDTYEWVYWINQGKGLYFNKEKVLSFLTNSRHPADVVFGFPDNPVQQEHSKLNPSRPPLDQQHINHAEVAFGFPDNPVQQRQTLIRLQK